MTIDSGKRGPFRSGRLSLGLKQFRIDIATTTTCSRLLVLVLLPVHTCTCVYVYIPNFALPFIRHEKISHIKISYICCTKIFPGQIFPKLRYMYSILAY